jgi:phenylacetate-CoA ligase
MRDAYAWFFRTALFPAWESTIRRRPTLHYWKRLEQSQWYSLDELKALQLQELKLLLHHAYRDVPYYRKAFDEASLHPDHIVHLDDLAKVPLLRRDQAVTAGSNRQANGVPLGVRKGTSGSTGNPITFGYDRNSEHWRQATRLRGYAWAGHLPGRKALHFWGSIDALYPREWAQRTKIRLDRMLRGDTYLDATLRSQEALEAAAQTLEQVNPHTFICFSQAGAALARYVNETGRRTWKDLPVICGAERLFDADRAALKQAFGPDVFETYGSREVMLMAAECAAHDGMHTSMENLIVEILVPDGTGMRRAAPGELGEVAVTDLHNYAMPFIRYLNGDLARWLPPTRCACGRALERIESVEGRKNDTMRDANGNPVDALFFNLMFTAIAEKVRRFQAVQRRDGSLDLRIVPAPAFDETVMDGIVQNCGRFLSGLETRVHLVDDIPVEQNGKLRNLVVER